MAKCVVGIEYGESLTRVELVVKDNLEKIKENIPAILEGPYYKGVTMLNTSSVDLLFVAKCKEAGMVLTGAGATFPYGKDPEDSNIRIAPTFPSIEEMEVASKVFVLCVKLCSANKLLADMN